MVEKLLKQIQLEKDKGNTECYFPESKINEDYKRLLVWKGFHLYKAYVPKDLLKEFGVKWCRHWVVKWDVN